MPAASDPILQRVESIRERDHLYIDTLQDYYGNFVRQMRTPCDEFRRLRGRPFRILSCPGVAT